MRFQYLLFIFVMNTLMSGVLAQDKIRKGIKISLTEKMFNEECKEKGFIKVENPYDPGVFLVFRLKSLSTKNTLSTWALSHKTVFNDSPECKDLSDKFKDSNHPIRPIAKLMQSQFFVGAFETAPPPPPPCHENNSFVGIVESWMVPFTRYIYGKPQPNPHPQKTTEEKLWDQEIRTPK